MKKVVAVCAVAVGALALLAGCGSSEETSVKTKSPITSSKGASSEELASLEGIPASSEVAKPTVEGDTVKIPIGAGKSISWKKGQKMNIAFFTIGSTNDYLVEQNNAVKEEAEKLGADVTTYDGNFESSQQVDQIQSALSSGKYNAIIANPVDPELECNLLSKTPASENILVTIMVGPLCDRGGADGAKTWVPGTLNFVGGDGQPETLEAYFEEIAKANPGKHEIALLVGPQDNPPSINAVNAMKAVVAKNPNLTLGATYYTDYSSQQGYQDTQTLLQSHPNVDLIVNSYAEITVGEVAALKQAGGEAEVKLYDKGGDSFDAAQVKDGTLAMDLPQYPVSNSKAAVDSLYLATQGKPVPRYLGNDGLPASEGPTYVTPQNVEQFTPQYKG